MPRTGMLWRHVIISTLNSWLPGDTRGFRNKKHRIHSSGDYKNPPLPNEHAGLHRYAKILSDEPVMMPADVRWIVGQTIVKKLLELDHSVLVISVAGMHAHFLAELPEKRQFVCKIVGQCKSVASHAIRDRLPGRVWAYGETAKGIRDLQHHRNTYQYILDQEDAWHWCYRDPIEGLSDEALHRLETLRRPIAAADG